MHMFSSFKAYSNNMHAHTHIRTHKLINHLPVEEFVLLVQCFHKRVLRQVKPTRKVNFLALCLPKACRDGQNGSRTSNEVSLADGKYFNMNVMKEFTLHTHHNPLTFFHTHSQTCMHMHTYACTDTHRHTHSESTDFITYIIQKH